MSEKKKSVLKKHAYKPGQSGNPSGRPKTPPDILEARRHSRDELERAVLKIVWSDKATVQREKEDESNPVILRIISGIALKALKTQDVIRSSFLLDRAGFPVKKEAELSISAALVNMPIDELLRLGREAMAVLSANESGQTLEIGADDEL